MTWEDRIELKPQVLCGKPVVKGTRISVEHVINPHISSDFQATPIALRPYFL